MDSGSIVAAELREFLFTLGLHVWLWDTLKIVQRW